MVNELLTIDFIGFGSLTRNSENEEELVLNQIINNYREKTDIEEKLNATVNLKYLFYYSSSSKFKLIRIKTLNLRYLIFFRINFNFFINSF